jgi:Predicted metalloendopeptidase
MRSLVCAVALSLGISSVADAQSGARALGVDTTNFDRSVRPQDDFFRFVNGGWLKRTEIPSDASSWGAFNELREGSRTALHTILDSALTTKAAPGSELQKVRDLYKSYMDSAAVEALGTKPLSRSSHTSRK